MQNYQKMKNEAEDIKENCQEKKKFVQNAVSVQCSGVVRKF
jgi:hypothetical protein